MIASWVFMWVLAFILWMGFKVLTLYREAQTGQKLPWKRTWAYLFLWPGMDAASFLTVDGTVPVPAFQSWVWAAVKTGFGVFLFWILPEHIPAGHPLLVGWCGLFGIIFLLHFGTFHLLALAFQCSGIRAQPLMQAPIRSTSLSEFWGQRWNLAFRQLAYPLLFHPIQKRWGASLGMIGAFLFSGLLHDLVISAPSGGGYGWPTMYFVLQAVGMNVERSSWGRYVGLGRDRLGWLFTMAVTSIPAFWLFHPPFVKEIILPMMSALGVSWKA